jgi:hypothetical protein
MLGHHPLLERKLRKSGRRAFATVLESDRTMYTETFGNDALVSNTRVLWKLKLSVASDGEPPFETDADVLLPQTWSPSSGTRFPVLYDPGDHSKVVIDQSDEGDDLLDEELDRSRVEARVARMRARGQDEMADRYVQAHEYGRRMYVDLPSDPDERQEELASRRAKMGEIMVGGTAGGQAAGGPTILINGQPVQPASAAGPASAAATADALTKLADLRDRGVLSKEEFEAQKKRLLGE